MLKTLLAIALLPALVAGQTQTKPSQVTADALLKQAGPSVVLLDVETNKGEHLKGAGFLAIKDGMALTSLKLVSDAKMVSAVFQDGNEYDVSGIVDSDSKRDIALVRVKVANRPQLSIASPELKVSDRAVVVGPLNGRDITVVDTSIGQLDIVGGAKEFTLGSPMANTCLGAPVLNAKGQVIGMLVAKADGDGLRGVPSAYSVGLDATHVTTPFQTVANPSSETGVFDNAAIAAIATILDSYTVSGYVNDRYVYREGGFKDGVPSVLYEASSNLDSRIRAMESASPREESRSILRDQLFDSLSKLKDGLELIAKSITESQKAYGWNTDTKDSLARANGILKSAISEQDAFGEFLKKPEVRKRAPHWMLQRFGLEKESLGFSLGVYTVQADPTLLMIVPKDSFATLLQLKSWDRIVSVGTVKVKNLEDFKQAISERLGTLQTITVIRGGETLQLSLTIPKDIPVAFTTG